MSLFNHYYLKNLFQILNNSGNKNSIDNYDSTYSTYMGLGVSTYVLCLTKSPTQDTTTIGTYVCTFLDLRAFLEYS